jgi:hypothetical protein
LTLARRFSILGFHSFARPFFPIHCLERLAENAALASR